MRKFIFVFSLLFFVNFAFANEDFTNDFTQEFAKSDVEVFDPLSGYNKVMTKFNDKAYTYVLSPITKGYAYVVPETARLGVSNFFDNLMFPVRFVNNLLQFKFQNSFEELGRFVINSTFGIAGLIDVASMHTKLEKHDEDFGQTLGFYGVGSGFHIVLPLLGPSNLRDTIGFAADGYISPLVHDDDISYKIPDDAKETVGISAFKYVNSSSFDIGKYEDMKKDAIDLYPFLRDIYEQKREKEIRE